MRPVLAVATVAVAALALAGCVEPAQPSPVPTASSTTPPTTAPEPTPTETTVPEPEPTEAPGPAALDPASLIDAVIAKDAASVVAQLGDPIREISGIADGERPAADVQADLAAALTNGENFKPADDATIASIAAGPHPEFAAAGAVVVAGTLGSVIAFLPGAIYFTTS